MTLAVGLPAFLIQRADGSYLNRQQYLANPAKVSSLVIARVVARQRGGTLVARYEVTTSEIINGQPYLKGPLPRLSVFNWNRARWQLVAHSNFALPAG